MLNSVITRASVLAVALLAVSAAFAQSESATPPSDVIGTIKSVIGINLPADIPTAYLATGVGVKQGQPLGWINAGKAIAPGLYLAGAVDMQQGQTSTRAGLEQCLFCSTQRGIYFSVKGDGGGSFGSGVTGGSYGVGGSLAVRLGKGSSRHVVVSATLVGSEISEFLKTPTAAGQISHLAAGVTWRIGLLNASLAK